MVLSADEAIDRYIDPESTATGPADARLAGTGVHVWALIGYLQANGERVDQAAADYGLLPEAIAAARAYYARHRAAIDARLALHAAFFGTPVAAT